MGRTGSCWTCRLRRKKCDQGQPACRTCSVLNIQCCYSTDRPDWMDGGEKQDAMTRRFKAQVRQGKERLRDREYVQGDAMGDGTKLPTTPWPDVAIADPDLCPEKDSTPRYNTL